MATISGSVSGVGAFITTVITATEANKLAQEYNAAAKIKAAVDQLNPPQTSVGVFGGSKVVSNPAGAISALRTVSGDLANASKKVAGPDLAVLQATANSQLKLATEQVYYSQIQAIRSTAGLGRFKLIFDLSEQAKQDLTPFLKTYGYTLTQIPVSDISNVYGGTGKMFSNGAAQYKGESISYYGFGSGSTMILVQW
jgi:hypothetical protein